MDLTQHRRDFTPKPRITPQNTPPLPLVLMQSWLNRATQTEINPNAFSLSTLVNQKPTARVVLLNEITEEGRLRFYSNYQSRKFEANEPGHWCALNFFWKSIEKQIIIEGYYNLTPAEVSDKYFNNRPVESQISAMASAQSQPIGSIAEVEKAADALRKTPQPYKRPLHWGGMDVTPLRFEFWQGQPARLHDRLVYQRNHQNQPWQKTLLAP